MVRCAQHAPNSPLSERPHRQERFVARTDDGARALPAELVRFTEGVEDTRDEVGGPRVATHGQEQLEEDLAVDDLHHISGNGPGGRKGVRPTRDEAEFRTMARTFDVGVDSMRRPMPSRLRSTSAAPAPRAASWPD